MSDRPQPFRFRLRAESIRRQAQRDAADRARQQAEADVRREQARLLELRAAAHAAEQAEAAARDALAAVELPRADIAAVHDQARWIDVCRAAVDRARHDVRAQEACVQLHQHRLVHLQERLAKAIAQVQEMERLAERQATEWRRADERRLDHKRTEDALQHWTARNHGERSQRP